MLEIPTLSHTTPDLTPDDTIPNDIEDKAKESYVKISNANFTQDIGWQISV